MQVDVYDSYAQKSDNQTIHFDVLVESRTPKEKAFEYGKRWLSTIDELPESLSQSRCNYCHTEEANQEVQKSIQEKGYYILQMEGCPNPIS